MNQNILGNIERYSSVIITTSDEYKREYAKYIEEHNKKLISKTKESFYTWWGHLISIALFGGIAYLINEVLGIVVIIIQFLFMLYDLYIWQPAKIEECIEKEKKKRDSIGILPEEKVKLFFENKPYEVKVLGKAFIPNQNNVTGKIKRDYLGDAFIAFPKENINYKFLIFNNHSDELKEKSFRLEDITALRVVEHDNLGEVKLSKKIDTSKIQLAEERVRLAERREVMSKIEHLRGGAISAISSATDFSTIDAHNKRVDAKTVREEIEKQVDLENKRIEEETYIVCFGIHEVTHLFLSHINKSVLHLLQERVESI